MIARKFQTNRRSRLTFRYTEFVFFCLLRFGLIYVLVVELSNCDEKCPRFNSFRIFLHRFRGSFPFLHQFKKLHSAHDQQRKFITFEASATKKWGHNFEVEIKWA